MAWSSRFYRFSHHLHALWFSMWTFASERRTSTCHASLWDDLYQYKLSWRDLAEMLPLPGIVFTHEGERNWG